MKNSYLFIACLFLLMGQRGWSMSVTKTVHFSHSELNFDTIKGGDGQLYMKMSYQGMEAEENVGFPTLPIKYVSIPLPYTADDITLSTHCSNTTSHILNARLFPVQEQDITSLENKERKFTPCESSIYASASCYPSEQVKITDVSCTGYGNRNVVIAVYPVVYYPVENRYNFCEDIEIIISYKYSHQRGQMLTRSTSTFDIGLPFYEYCIITNHQLENSFTRLLAWIREKGINAGVVRIEDIRTNNYVQNGDTVSNINDNAGKLRQYLQYAKKYGDTKYVLMGGNDSILPIRYGSRAESLLPDCQIPSDLYFSELNSNWNEDGDIYYGENKSSMDYGSELQVGRLLCTNSDEVKNYTDKLLRYELKPGNGDTSYLSKIFCSQADQMQNTQESGNQGQANIIASEVQDIFPVSTILSEIPNSSDPYPTFPTGNDIISTMNQHFGYVSWFNHGNPTSITAKAGNYRNDPYGMASICGNIPYIAHETANGLDSLDNKDYPMIAYSIACDITPFDIYDEVYQGFPNIGQSFTLGQNYGGPALIGNTRVGFVSSTYKVQKLFNQQIRNHSIGTSLNIAKVNNTNDKHHHALVVNIIGCPDINIWTSTPVSFNPILSYNSTGGGMLYANNAIDSAYVCIRQFSTSTDFSQSIPYVPSSGGIILENVYNKLITLKGRNCLPQILPLYLQNTTLHGSHYLIAKDINCGSDVRIGETGKVTFDEDADYTFETNGTVTFTKNVEIKHGARLCIKSSNINY